ncbi:MAG: AraC family transcriptional regulator [Alphaproteobacteria bacterium]
MNALEMPQISADRVVCALQHRVLGTGPQAGDRLWRCLLLTAGTGTIGGGEAVALAAPCLAWMPWQADRTLTVHAGAVGFQLAVDQAVLASVVANNPESAGLRQLADRRVVAAIDDADETVADIENAFGLVARELRRPQGGSLALVQAQLCTILVILWRLSGSEAMALRTQGEPSRILQRFRQLVEMHFRDRWSIAAYAATVGLSTDRLHDICRRHLGKTPSQLVQERVLHEARLSLRRSTLTVEQVAAALGFRDVAHFSRFFKAKIGLPPATYRRSIHLAQGQDRGEAVETYADWP